MALAPLSVFLVLCIFSVSSYTHNHGIWKTSTVNIPFVGSDGCYIPLTSLPSSVWPICPLPSTYSSIYTPFLSIKQASTSRSWHRTRASYTTSHEITNINKTETESLHMNEWEEYVIPSSLPTQRLDLQLAAMFPQYSRSSHLFTFNKLFTLLHFQFLTQVLSKFTL